MCKIAACVLTYNHPDVVEDVLSNCIDDYYEYGIDIYYYDSSETDETEKVVRKYQEMGYTNLYHVKLPSDITYQKMIYVLDGKYLEKEYDYIWPLKDRSYCPKETLEEIMTQAKLGYDVIFLATVRIEDNLKNTICTDAKEFYGKWGWLATSWDVSIFRRKTFLEGIKHHTFKELPLKSWQEYTTIFYRLAELENPTICILAENNIRIKSIQNVASGWDNPDSLFWTWKTTWIIANEVLPDCYNEYKDYNIKRAATLPWTIGGIPRLMELHEKGILTADKMDELEGDWDRVSDVPIEIVRQIAYGTYDPYHDVSIIKDAKSEMANLLIQLVKVMKVGQMSKEQIPFDDIIVCIHSELENKRRYSEEKLYSIYGTIEDTKQFILREDTSNEEMVKAIQVLINILILADL